MVTGLKADTQGPNNVIYKETMSSSPQPQAKPGQLLRRDPLDRRDCLARGGESSCSSSLAVLPAAAGESHVEAMRLRSGKPNEQELTHNTLAW